MQIKILLAEDDVNLGLVISDQLRMDGYKVTLCMDGVEALQCFNENQFHLCVFDVMMPKKDGFTLAKDIRNINSDIPILFLTAKSMLEDKAKGFNSGGDDYLTKPFSVEELQLRIKALLKRVNLRNEQPEDKVVFIGEYTFDIENYTLLRNGEKKSLTKKEAHILKVLFKFKNQVVPREVILNAVWGQDDYFIGRSFDVFITKIRKYLKDDPNIKLTNIHGVGFKFEIEE